MQMASIDRLQGLSGDLAIKAPVRVATTAAITLSGLQTIDGALLVADDRVLVKDQADTTANGIYVASSSGWTRSLDCNGINDLVNGTFVIANSGTTNAGVMFKCGGTDPITVGTDAITFTAQFTLDTLSAVSALLTALLADGAQPADASLTAYAALVTAANKGLYFTGADVPALFDLTAFARTLLDDANAATARATLGVVDYKEIQPIVASVATNALTLTLNPTVLDFRDATLTTGTTNTRTVAAAISVVVPDTATLGTTNATAARLALLAIDNAGTVELAVVNLAGGNNLDETTLISTTAISTGADSANVIYSTSARTNVPFRVVGFIDITEATAGAWATAPTTVQGAGGNAAAAMMSLGYGQTYQDVSASRAFTTTYYNTTGRPIALSVWATQNGNGYVEMLVNGVVVAAGEQGYVSSARVAVAGIIPPGASYSVQVTGAVGTLAKWFEMR